MAHPTRSSGPTARRRGFGWELLQIGALKTGVEIEAVPVGPDVGAVVDALRQGEIDVPSASSVVHAS